GQRRATCCGYRFSCVKFCAPPRSGATLLEKPFRMTQIASERDPGPVECGHVCAEIPAQIAGSRDRATRTILSMTSGLIALWMGVQYENARNDCIHAHDYSRCKCRGRKPILPGYVS